jgi:hypothetical protein
MEKSLCTAMTDGLRLNKTLESLQLNKVHLTDDNSDLWSRVLSVLLTNKSLKILVVNLNVDVTESRVAAFRSDIVAVLEEKNVSLESLSISSFYTSKAEEYLALITALQQNTTLKTLGIHHFSRVRLLLTHDEEKQMASLLKNKYVLERLPDIDLENEAGNVGAILRLNEAGRRYLVQDGSSISKGVEVLSAVSDEINCVFLHLLENPRLCDRSAVEIVNDSTQRSIGSASPANDNGKREQNQGVKDGKESRRRWT